MWIAPKTDWKKGDTVNIAPDWNRITGNITALYEEAKSVAGIFPLTEMPQLAASDYPLSEYLNSVEYNYDILTRKIWPDGPFLQRRTIAPEGRIWNQDDLNRIESKMLNSRPMIDKSMASRPSLSFLMGVDAIGSFV